MFAGREVVGGPKGPRAKKENFRISLAYVQPLSTLKMAGRENTVGTPIYKITVWRSPCLLRGGGGSLEPTRPDEEKSAAVLFRVF